MSTDVGRSASPGAVPGRESGSNPSVQSIGSFIRRRWLPVVCCLGFVCLLAWQAGWFDWRPGESPPGASSSFDRLLEEAGTGRRFLFDTGEKLVATSLPDGPDEVLLDLYKYKNVPFTWNPHASLAPDRRRVLVPFSADFMTQTTTPRLLLLDLSSGRADELPVPHGPSTPEGPDKRRYEFDHLVRGRRLLTKSPIHWLSPDVFVLFLIRCTPGGRQHRYKYLRYHISWPDAPREMDLDVGCPEVVVEVDGSLLVGEHCRQGEQRILVIDAAGQRLASERERQSYLRQCERQDLPGGPCSAGVAKVQERSLFFPEWDYEVRFDGRLVRWVDKQPELWWEPDLGLYVWVEPCRGSQSFFVDASGHRRRVGSGEGPSTYVADPAGHYRRLHEDRYIGFFPVSAERCIAPTGQQ